MSFGKSKQSYNNKNGSSLKKIGYVTLTSKAKKEGGQALHEDLVNSKLSVWARISLPKGTNAMELKNKDKLLITFMPLTNKEGEVIDYAVGSISIQD